MRRKQRCCRWHSLKRSRKTACDIPESTVPRKGEKGSVATSDRGTKGANLCLFAPRWFHEDSGKVFILYGEVLYGGGDGTRTGDLGRGRWGGWSAFKHMDG